MRLAVVPSGAEVLAARQAGRTLEHGDDLADRDALGGSSQPVAAAGAALRFEQPGSRQLLHRLREQPPRDRVVLADLADAHHLPLAVDEVEEGDEAVFGALGQLQHGPPGKGH